MYVLHSLLNLDDGLFVESIRGASYCWLKCKCLGVGMSGKLSRDSARATFNGFKNILFLTSAGKRFHNFGDQPQRSFHNALPL